MTQKWNKPAFIEVLKRLEALQLRVARIQAAERMKRATALVQTHIKYSEKKNG